MDIVNRIRIVTYFVVCLFKNLFQSEEELEERRAIVQRVYATANRVPKNPTFMAGYPA
jgi:hypothetical protein